MSITQPPPLRRQRQGFMLLTDATAPRANPSAWNEQAVKSAENYLDTTSFSRSGLVHQLKFEGFTTSQAKHGVAKAY